MIYKRALQALPEDYHQAATLDIIQDKKLIIFLNIAGLVLVVLCGWLFFYLIARVRPGETANSLVSININSLFSLASLVFWILFLTALHVILHEGVHGFFFWVFTGAKPGFAFRWTHAYAAAPDWYIRRTPYLITALAPLILISLGGVALTPWLPSSAILAAWYILTMNAGGSVGDLAAAIWVLRRPADCLIQDRGESMTLFLKDNF